MKRNPESLTLYHGTQRSKLKKILKTGLKPSPGWVSGRVGVYLSGTIDGALYWAKMIYMAQNGEKLEIERFDRKHGENVDKLLVIVRVTVPESAFDRLKADMEQAEDVMFEGGEDDWRASLAEIGDVMFDGAVPASWISEI